MILYRTRPRSCLKRHTQVSQILSALVIVALTAGCSPTTPQESGPKIPASQQEAQDAVFNYLQRTVDSLPRGTTLDANDFRGGANMSCEDEPMTDTPPTRYEYWTNVVADAGASTDDLISKTGDAWRGWGAEVKERDDFRKPNRFGYLPDGYELQIKGAAKSGYPPTLIVTSPCFPGEVARTDIPSPRLIEQSPWAG